MSCGGRRRRGSWVVLSQVLGSKSNLRRAATIENDKLRFQENVTKNGESDAIVGLKASVTGTARYSTIVEVSTWHNGVVAPNLKSERAQGRAAGKEVGSVVGVVGATVL